MSGHSKWNNIKARKGKQDAVRGKIFTKLGRELYVAVKAGGPDPQGNATLAAVIAKAKANNMPNDTINNAIKKASGAGSTENYEEIVYEGYGANGVAVIVEAMTNNKNRTASEVRHTFDKNGGKLGTTGCVSYMFSKKGLIVIERETTTLTEEEMLELAMEVEAEDLKTYDEVFEIITEPTKFSSVLQMLEEKGIKIMEANISMIPGTNVELDEKAYERIEKLVETLEDNDDIQNVYHNAVEAE